MELLTFQGKTVDEAITNASIELGIASSDLVYEVESEGSTGFLGMFAKPAIIKVQPKVPVEKRAKEFLDKLFEAMKVETEVKIEMDKENNSMDIELSGPDMGILIGKRGQTLDSIQYLTSLYVNKESDAYIRVKIDTENYRERRKETLETLAKNIAYKVKRTRRSVYLEPMNPYERRIIHSALQNDKYVCTKSEGEEPYRKVVVMLKRS
ncbi:MAG: protein jag [Lachnospiraceae bacterium]|nr:protein jag [Lachnospiraceae bacterium]